MKAVDINEAIESVVEVSRNVWKYVAQCKLDLDPCLPRVTCLTGEIKQVFMNLMINAVDAIKAKHAATGDSALGEIRIRTTASDDDVIVTVSDTGTGVSAAVGHRIFEPFFTTDPTRAHRGQGLALAYASVVKHHGGRLTFENNTEQGAVFRVLLPVRPINDNEKEVNHDAI